MDPDDAHYEALTFKKEEPNIGALKKEFEETISDLSSFFQKTRRSYNNRRNLWANKSWDNKKTGAAAFPWEGASDQDAPVIEERLFKLTGKLSTAIERSQIKAYPIGIEDTERAANLSTFLKWLQQTGIPDFGDQADLAASYLLEKTLMITHVGYHKKQLTALHTMAVEDFPPEIQTLLTDPKEEEELVNMIEQSFEGISRARARKAARDLRIRKTTEIPIPDTLEQHPTTRACAPDSDVIFPSWTQDPQKAPWVAYRELMTPQDVLGKVVTEEWDQEWAEEVIEKARGKQTVHLENDQVTYRSGGGSETISNRARQTDLIEVVYFYQRLVDEVDQSEGIYCTVFCPHVTEGDQYAKQELLSGFTYYPIVVTPFLKDQKTLYDSASLPDMLRSAQHSIKLERDQRADANALRTVPPRGHPVGSPPVGNWGPGQNLGYHTSPEEYQYLDAPDPNPQSVNDEMIIAQQADRLCGLDPEDPHGADIIRYIVGRYLKHFSKVLKYCYDFERRFGPDERFFRVTGHPDTTSFKKNPEEQIDVTVEFDSIMTDPDAMEAIFDKMARLFEFDDSGILGRAEFIQYAANAISPTLSNAVLKGGEGSREFTAKVVDDLGRIMNGFDVNAQPQGAPQAMQIIEAWAQTPDVTAKIEANEALQERLKKYAEQYEFQMTQQQNAIIGRLGTQPAEFGSLPGGSDAS